MGRTRLERIDELDGLRGLLAMWVVTTHVLCWTGFATVQLPRHLAQFWPDFIFGQPAVEVFMILSGFAIAFLLYAKQQSYVEFMRGRFFRIYPTYLFCLLIGVFAMQLVPYILKTASWRSTIYFTWVGTSSREERGQLWAHLLAHLSLLNGLIPASILKDASNTILPPAWSITLEWQFYLAAPLIILLSRRGIGFLVLGFVSFLGIHYSDYWSNPHLAFLLSQLPFFSWASGAFNFTYTTLARMSPG